MPNGYLAKKYCGLDLPIKVLRSRAGYYIGTHKEDGTPVSRESDHYWLTKQEAEHALTFGHWIQKQTP